MDRNNLEKLLSKLNEALRMDVNNVYLEASQGKLSASSARDLVAYLEFLKEESEQIDPAKLSDDELEKLVNKIVDLKGKK